MNELFARAVRIAPDRIVLVTDTASGGILIQGQTALEGGGNLHTDLHISEPAARAICGLLMERFRVIGVKP